MDMTGIEMPRRFSYISHRITREIVERYGARSAGKFRLQSFDVSGGVEGDFVSGSGSAKFDREAIETPQDYAVAATGLVASQTGTLFNRDNYIRTILDFNIGSFYVYSGWENQYNQRVCAIYTTQIVDGRRVFLGLFGSEANLNILEKTYSNTGRTPSDADGLYAILQATREPEEVQVDSAILSRRYEVGMPDQERAQSAFSILYPLVEPFPSRPLDVLLEPHVVLEDVRLHMHRNSLQGHGIFDLVIIGAAVWAGTPAPRNFFASHSALVRSEKAQLLDEAHITFADALLQKGDLSYPRIITDAINQDEAWLEVVDWFFLMAGRYGMPMNELLVHRLPHRFSPRRMGRRPSELYYNSKPKRTGIGGLSVELSGASYLFTRSGELYLVEREREGLVYTNGTQFSMLEARESPIPTAIERVVALQALWAATLSWRLALPIWEDQEPQHELEDLL